MADAAGSEPIERRTYELTRWRVPGPVEPIPALLYHRADLPGPKPGAVYYHGVVQNKEVYVAGHPLARRLADAGLIDQYNLLVFPVLLGAGKSLFGRADRDKQMLTLRESESYSNGILKLVYDVKR
jgi:dihydrofolate reductase